MLRRESLSKTPKIQVGDLILDTLTREAWRGDRKIDLTTKEYSILEYFMSHPNMVITRTMLEENAWDYEYDSMSNIIDVYIRRLRRKIDGDTRRQPDSDRPGRRLPSENNMKFFKSIRTRLTLWYLVVYCCFAADL